MKQIQLAYGSEGINFAFDENRFEVLSPASEAPLSDAGIGEALDTSIDYCGRWRIFCHQVNPY